MSLGGGVAALRATRGRQNVNRRVRVFDYGGARVQAASIIYLLNPHGSVKVTLRRTEFKTGNSSHRSTCILFILGNVSVGEVQFFRDINRSLCEIEMASACLFKFYTFVRRFSAEQCTSEANSMLLTYMQRG